MKAVFLDIDGVVVLSEPLHQEKIVMTAQDPLHTGRFDKDRGVLIDLKTQWDAELAGIGDHRIYGWIKKKNAQFPLSEEQFLAACEHYYLENANRLRIRDTFPEAFSHFEKSGVHLVAVSSGVRAQVDRNLEFAGINSRIEFSDSADDVEPGKTKPHPAPYLNALKKLNARLRAENADHIDIRPQECLVVEDSGPGIASGHAAGMKTVHWTLTPSQKFHDEADYKLGPKDSFLVLAQAVTSPSGDRRPFANSGLNAHVVRV